MLPVQGRGRCGRFRPGELDPRPLPDPVAVRADAAVCQLHHAAHDEESEPRAVVPATAAVQAREPGEQTRAVSGREADAGVAHAELHLAVGGARLHLDAAAAGRLHRCQRVLEDVAQHHVECQRIALHAQRSGDVAAKHGALLARALLERRQHPRHRGRQRHRLGPQLHAAALEARALEDLRDHQLHARQIRQHALDERARGLRRRGAQRQRLERELQAGERRLELVGDQREKALLFLAYPRLGTQRTRDHRDAQRQRQQEERALPGVLVVAMTLLARQRLLDLRSERCASVAHHDRGKQLRDALRAHSRIEQRLRRGGLLTVGAAGRQHLLDGIGVLVVQPPADLHGGHHHQGERGELEDARRFHASSASVLLSACTKRASSALPCASDRKHAS